MQAFTGEWTPPKVTQPPKQASETEKDRATTCNATEKSYLFSSLVVHDDSSSRSNQSESSTTSYFEDVRDIDLGKKGKLFFCYHLLFIYVFPSLLILLFCLHA